MVVVRGRPHGRTNLVGVGRGDDRHRRLHPHDPDVLERVVGDAVVPVVQATTHPDEPHRQLVQQGAVAQELVSAHRGEGRDRVGERAQAGLSQTGGHTEHVLLSDPDVVKAVGVILGKRFERGEPKVPR